ncbi:MAG: methyltransferase domain-containing protein, partial [Alphaproteobacteria bacterium]
MTVRSLIKRSIALTCAYYLVDDWLARRRVARGDLSTRSGSRHAALTLDQSLAYIEGVYRAYLDYAGRAYFQGTVAEIGPGDNFGVALLLRAGGTQEVHAVDRYRPRREKTRQAEIYRALAERHALQPLFDGEPGEAAIKGLVYHAGCPAETFFRDSGLRFDAVLSRAVLEHLYDPIAAVGDMYRALNPGGVLVHRIDFRDHGMFAGHHPLTFLTVPDAVYRRMTRGAGRPNRVLAPAYRAWLERAGARGRVHVTRL